MRRKIVSNAIVSSALVLLCKFSAFTQENAAKYDSREYWVATMIKIADPVLKNLSQGQLRAKMPVINKDSNRVNVAHLEAFGRTLAGIAPWLELGADNSTEGKLRSKYIQLTRKALAIAVDPSSPDFLNFNKQQQPLVDAAFMAQGLLRGYTQLWEPLDNATKSNIVDALKSSRVIKPGENNWLLFSAIIEAFLIRSGNGGDVHPIVYALQKHVDWYKGDGTYGDGEDLHWDYYNSFVIQPMMLDITRVLSEKNMDTVIMYQKVLNRAQRYAAVQERLISPEGTYPPIGRSMIYRFGAFQLLSQITLQKNLPAEISPAQVRTIRIQIISLPL